MTTERKQWVSWEELNALSLSPYSIVDYSRISGLTPGSVPFADADGMLDQDNANLFWDAVNAFLGVHEMTPTALVHITGGGAIPALCLESGVEGELVTPDGQQFRIGHWNGVDTFTERLRIDDDGKFYVSYLTTGSVIFAGADGEMMHDGTNFYYNVGTNSLGLGTVPTNILHIYGVGTTSGWGGAYGGVVARFWCTENKHTSIVVDSKAGYDSVIGLSTAGAVKWSIRNDVGDPDSFEIRYNKGAANRLDFEITNAGAVNIPTGLTTVKDLSVTTPVNAYNLSHDLFADYIAAEHYDWTNETHDFLTTGTLASGNITMQSETAIFTINATSENAIIWVDSGADKDAKYVFQNNGVTKWQLFNQGISNALFFNPIAGSSIKIDQNLNFGLGQTTFGTNMTKGIAVGTGVDPDDSPADCFQMYSADIAAGHAAMHLRNENDTIIKLYQQAHIADPAGQANDLDSEARIAINAILLALENNGLLANA